jgi:hypothetical protein
MVCKNYIRLGMGMGLGIPYAKEWGVFYDDQLAVGYKSKKALIW